MMQDANKAEKELSLPALAELHDEFLRVAANERRSSNRGLSRTAMALVGLGLFVAAIFLAELIFDSDAQPERRATRPAVGAFAGHGPSYSSLRELADNSSLVVVGTVTDTRIGQVFDDDPTGQYPTRLLHTGMSIDEVLKGPTPSGDLTIATDELAFAAPNLDDWRKAGTRVLLFLTPSREGRYVLANLDYPQTAYFVRGEDIEAAMGDPLSTRIASMSLSDVRQRVLQP
jgi:hypothetical protein